jgi:photosystem II stability/assembly factor-like uncharacterized protein
VKFISSLSILFYFVAVVLFSCKKSDSPIDTSPIIKPDTLSAGWTKIPFASGGSDFYDIFFYQSSVGYAVGNGLWKSTNGGLTWLELPSHQGTNLAVTQNGALFIVPIFSGNGLYKSTNGGQNFLQMQTTGGAHEFKDIFFTGNDTGYISTKQGLLRSTDAGNNWSPVTANGLPSGSNYYSLFFYNDNIGWICDSNSVYKTSNNINNWTKAIIHTNTPFQYVYGIYPTSTSIIYLLVSNGEIYKSTDGGANFYIKNTQFLTQQFYISDIHFVDTNTGYVSLGRKIFKTVDGGTTWQREVALGEKDIIEIHFTDANHGWACANGQILVYVQ